MTRSRHLPGTADCRQSSESFRPPFLKGGAVKGAEPLSRSAERETPLRRFLFAKLFLCAYMVKEKASFGIVLFLGGNTFCLQYAVPELCRERFFRL